MKKLSVIQVTVQLLLSYRISYACIGLSGRSFRDCHLDHFCAEARIAKSLKVRDEEKNNNELRFLHQAQMQSPFVFTISDENDRFLECCRKRGLPEVCLQKCSYNSYNQTALRRMFLHVDPCPLLSASDIHFCAAQGHDHRQCCAINGVTTTVAGEKCLIFCDQRTQNSTILDMSYLPCFERFENIKGCFSRWTRQHYYQLAERSKKSEIYESKTTSDRIMQLKTKQPPSPFNNYR